MIFEVTYNKDQKIIKHIDVDVFTLLDLLKAHKNRQISILSVEDSNHKSYKFESLISNLVL